MNTIEIRIRKATKADSETLAEILRAAFQPIASKFSLNKSICPTHTSFVEKGWLDWEFDHGAEYLIGHDEKGYPLSCVSIKSISDDAVELRRLAVLPEYQHKGLGRRMVREIEKMCRDRNICRIKVGIVAQHSELHEWYKSEGYIDTSTEMISALPFKVQYMEKRITNDNNQDAR